MVKILRGSGGQADYVSQSSGYTMTGPDTATYPDGWAVSNAVESYSAGVSAGEWYYGDPGWNLTAAGFVTVPDIAPPGVYTASYTEIDYGTTNEFGDYAAVTYNYEFEVVCMILDIIFGMVVE